MLIVLQKAACLGSGIDRCPRDQVNHVMRANDRSPLPLEQLRQAHVQQDLVVLNRSIPGADDVVGHVVGLGARWVLLSVVSGGSPNGWVAVQVEDLEAVSISPGGQFVRRGLVNHKSWPPSAPRVQLKLSAGPAELIESAAHYFPLVTLYGERQDPLTCAIGRPVCWTDGYLQWQQMRRDAAWDDAVTSCELEQITRVDLGGQYEMALARVADLRGCP